MAFAGVVRPIGGDARHVMMRADLAQEFRQHGCVTDVAGSDLYGADFQCLLIDAEVDLAPDPALGARGSLHWHKAERHAKGVLSALRGEVPPAIERVEIGGVRL